MEIVVGIIGTLVALASAVFAYFQAQAAKHSLRQASRLRFFSAFDLANQLCVENPDLLRSVHGVNLDTQEAQNVAYLSLLLDAFQHYYGEKYDHDFKVMEAKLKKQSSFLNNILSLPQNQQRWLELKKLYYGDFDSGFISAVEALIEYENSKPNRALPLPADSGRLQ